jgi:hypothetical protein
MHLLDLSCQDLTSPSRHRNTVGVEPGTPFASVEAEKNCVHSQSQDTAWQIRKRSSGVGRGRDIVGEALDGGGAVVSHRCSGEGCCVCGCRKL